MFCSFCGKECKNHNSFINHERLCPDNPNKQKSGLSKKGRIPWNKGLTKKDPRVRKCAETFKKSIEDGNYIPHRTAHTEEFKQKMAKHKRELYDSGWEPTCGRCKKYDYDSPIAGKIKVDGTWELIVAKYLDTLKVKWVRNKKRFSYIKPNGISSTYQPDFFVSDWDSYIEVKGYETDLDRAKWSQFPHKLIVWKRNKIKQLENVSDRV